MTDKVDLSAYNLLICTPTMDGKVELSYQHSLDYTKRTIEEHGGKCCAFFVKYIADIAYARAKLFSTFIRKKEFTHILFIDADMSWPPNEVAYFLLLKRDFIAAAGPKKKFPIEYAYNMVGDNGKKSLLYHELETNVSEVPYVGGAFVMLSRHCAERLVEAYPEQQFYSPDEEIDYAVFDPIILTEDNQKRRLSEDYALCYRWRRLGGKVYVKMDVTLEHTGGHTFMGNLYQHLLETEASFREVVING